MGNCGNFSLVNSFSTLLCTDDNDGNDDDDADVDGDGDGDADGSGASVFLSDIVIIAA